MVYTCGCCTPAKSYSRSDKLANHRKKHDPNFVGHFELLKAARAAYYAAPIKCEREGCVEPVPFGERDRQRFCGHSCRAIVVNGQRVTRASRKEKMCPICANPFKKKGAKHCGDDCYRKSLALEAQQRIDDWLSGATSGSRESGDLTVWARNHLLEQAGHRCSICGWGQINAVTGRSPVQVDHIDGNYRNNRPDNLRVLCPNCHSLTPTYGALNMGNGRDHRRAMKQLTGN